MKRLIFIILLVKLCPLYAQQKYADTLLNYELKAFAENENSQKILTQKFNFLLKQKDYVAAHNELTRINKQTLNETALWNACLLSLQQKDFTSAEDYFKLYWLHADTSSLRDLTLAFLTYLNTDSARANSFLRKIEVNNPEYSCLRCYYRLLEMENTRALPFIIPSALVPGSGLILLGKPMKGLTSAAIATGFVIASISMINAGLVVNLVGWTAGWGVKFYLGQLGLTEKEHHNRFTKKKSKKADACRMDFSEKLKFSGADYRFD